MSVLDKLSSGEVFILAIVLIVAAAAVLMAFADALGKHRSRPLTAVNPRAAPRAKRKPVPEVPVLVQPALWDELPPSKPPMSAPPASPGSGHG